MAQLMISNQQKTDNETIILKSVPFHGDQLFEERARNTQWVYQDGDNAYDRLEGLETEFADWHAKLNLYMVWICPGKSDNFNTKRMKEIFGKFVNMWSL